ncbi:MAG: FHA domain-containing protein [Phycisphaerae bacterium]|nr:FHA domain-containing protein [Phycisphaerae bacterium]
MALTVCCPCGAPLECERVDLLVHATCPACGRALQIELDDGHKGRNRAILTVMEGPFWVGEQFVMPIGQDLFIGKGEGNWLSLESDEIADRHCRIKVTPRGAVQIEDMDSVAGTWIGSLRIARGKLHPTESFRIGEYRLRLDFQAAIGGEIVSRQILNLDESYILPELRPVESSKSIIGRLVTNRFGVAREMIVHFSWLIAAYHLFALRAAPRNWQWYEALMPSVLMLAALNAAGRKVALVHHYFKFAVIGVLIAIVINDAAAWADPLPAIGALVFAASLPLLTVQTPSPGRATAGAILAGLAIVYSAIIALRAALLLF